MSAWKSINNKVMCEIRNTPDGGSIVIRTIFTHLGKTLGLRILEDDDKEEAQEILSYAEMHNINIGVMLVNSSASNSRFGVDGVRMFSKARKMMNDGARVIEI